MTTKFIKTVWACNRRTMVCSWFTWMMMPLLLYSACSPREKKSTNAYTQNKGRLLRPKVQIHQEKDGTKHPSQRIQFYKNENTLNTIIAVQKIKQRENMRTIILCSLMQSYNAASCDEVRWSLNWPINLKFTLHGF